eukprot:82987-Chlamydomonas_euryale.AAC.1
MIQVGQHPHMPERAKMRQPNLGKAFVSCNNTFLRACPSYAATPLGVNMLGGHSIGSMLRSSSGNVS